MSELQKGSGEYRQQRLKEIVKDLHEGSDIKVGADSDSPS